MNHTLPVAFKYFHLLPHFFFSPTKKSVILVLFHKDKKAVLGADSSLRGPFKLKPSASRIPPSTLYENVTRFSIYMFLMSLVHETSKRKSERTTIVFIFVSTSSSWTPSFLTFYHAQFFGTSN